MNTPAPSALSVGKSMDAKTLAEVPRGIQEPVTYAEQKPMLQSLGTLAT